jgi:hypothetical protein
MRKETLDFVQLNYSIDDRAAERTLLPLAADRGAAVLVNLPFGGGGLLRRLSNRPLPDWAGEIGCTSWAQILLKFVLAEPAVTCVIRYGKSNAYGRQLPSRNGNAAGCCLAQAHHRSLGGRKVALDFGGMGRVMTDSGVCDCDWPTDHDQKRPDRLPTPTDATIQGCCPYCLHAIGSH